MSKERIFELIRKEEVVLFAGAGLSLYAGYPSGAKLAEIFYNNLTSDLREQINFSHDLPKLAEDIYNLKNGNKNYLIQILKKEFQKKPVNTEVHDILKKIPQINSIITTNYDDLFESTNSNLEVIRKSSDYPVAESKKQFLFKIHGDLSDSKSIILTNSDYNNYFINNVEQTIFWNAIKDKLVSNHILFIGYSLEDSNIQVIIEKIFKEIGDTRKEVFFVSPSISKPKLGFLQRNGIEFIESTGEDFIKELYDDLKHNYLPGLSKGNGSADTAFNFAKSNNLSIQLGEFNNGIIINGAKAISGDNQNQIKFKFEFPEEQKDRILDSIYGKNFDDVILDGNFIKEYSLFMNGIRLKHENEIEKIEIKKIPVIEGSYEFVFDDGFEIDNIAIEIFSAVPTKNQLNLKIILLDFILIVKIIFENNSIKSVFNVEIIPNEIINSVNNGLNFYNILYRIVSNVKFNLYKNNQLFFRYDNRLIINDENAFDAKLLKEYFEKLKKIERHFNIRFSNINLNDYNKKNINRIVSYIDNVVLEENFEGMTFKNENEEEFKFLIEGSYKNKFLSISEKQKTIINLHNIDFTIGYLHKYIQDGYIENLQALLNKETDIFNMKSKSNKIYVQFSDNKTIITDKV